jgi:hypothetical protein
MKIVEDHIMEESEEKRYRMCEPLVQDIDTTIFDPESPTLVGDIFRYSQKEFGRCVSKVYQDTKDGVKAVGWVFQKRERYEDSRETFIHETWVSLYDEWQPTIIKKPHFIA